MMSRNLCLAGMMGAGKSTVAALLGARLGRRVVDTDTEIERWTSRSIPEVFADEGEQGFRCLERQVIEELAQFHDLVIALGGGVVLDEANVRALALTGVIVHLHASPDVLAARLDDAGQGRPLIDGLDRAERIARLTELARARAPRYAAAATVVIDADRPVPAVADDVIDWAMAQGDVLTPSEHEQVMT